MNTFITHILLCANVAYEITLVYVRMEATEEMRETECERVCAGEREWDVTFNIESI